MNYFRDFIRHFSKDSFRKNIYEFIYNYYCDFERKSSKESFRKSPSAPPLRYFSKIVPGIPLKKIYQNALEFLRLIYLKTRSLILPRIPSETALWNSLIFSNEFLHNVLHSFFQKLFYRVLQKCTFYVCVSSSKKPFIGILINSELDIFKNSSSLSSRK